MTSISPAAVFNLQTSFRCPSPNGAALFWNRYNYGQTRRSSRNMVVAIFRKCGDTIRKSEMFIKNKTNVTSGMSCVERGVMYLGEVLCIFCPIRRNSVSKSSLKVFEQGRGHLNRCSGQGALCQFPVRKLWWLLEGISSVVHIRADLKNRRQLALLLLKMRR